ncbi:DNA N-6-adenine-methyltransferase [Marinobacterium sp. BA1]
MSIGTGMTGRHLPSMQKDEWLTPPEIIKVLGPFDLDPCSPADRRPWDTATVHLGVEDNGLDWEWFGRVWLNPPYGREAAKWLERMADHGNGIALVFARTETDMFFRHVWQRAHSILFIRGRLHFHHVDGTRAKANSGAPSCLIAYSDADTEVLRSCGIEGQLVELQQSESSAA